MGILLDNASTEYLYVNDPPVTAAPFTWTCWFNSDQDDLHQILLFLGDKDDDDDYWFFRLSGATGGDPLIHLVKKAGFAGATTTTGFTAGKWHFAAGVEVAANSRKAYIDGGSVGSDANNLTPNAGEIDRLAIGYKANGNPGSPTSGIIGEAAIWDAALTADELLALAAHIWAPRIRPGNLVFYLPMWTVADLTDLVGGRLLTAVNTPQTAEHPYIIKPRKTTVWMPSGGAPSGNPYYAYAQQQ